MIKPPRKELPHDRVRVCVRVCVCVCVSVYKPSTMGLPSHPQCEGLVGALDQADGLLPVAAQREVIHRHHLIPHLEPHRPGLTALLHLGQTPPRLLYITHTHSPFYYTLHTHIPFYCKLHTDTSHFTINYTHPILL